MIPVFKKYAGHSASLNLEDYSRECVVRIVDRRNLLIGLGNLVRVGDFGIGSVGSAYAGRLDIPTPRGRVPINYAEAQ